MLNRSSKFLIRNTWKFHQISQSQNQIQLQYQYQHQYHRFMSSSSSSSSPSLPSLSPGPDPSSASAVSGQSGATARLSELFSHFSPSTRLIHSDAAADPLSADISPALHLSTTFRSPNPDSLIYSRYDTVNRRRLETLLAAIEEPGDGRALVFSSGLSAALAALMALRPAIAYIEIGYFGCLEVFKLFGELHGVPVRFLSRLEFEAASRDPNGKCDLVWLESPSNPVCRIHDVAAVSEICQRFAKRPMILVDSTLATPLGSAPLKSGADIVLHSLTKYVSGHSDVLAGSLTVSSELAHSRGGSASLFSVLSHHRHVSGSVPGNFDCWLLLRSLRTLKVRVREQANSAAAIVAALSQNPAVAVVHHPLHPSHPDHSRRSLMNFPPSCFSFELFSASAASALPSHLKLFANATSLGGVESLIDYRHTHDPTTSPRLLRISIGLEDSQELIEDLNAAFKKVAHLNTIPSNGNEKKYIRFA